MWNAQINIPLFVPFIGVGYSYSNKCPSHFFFLGGKSSKRGRLWGEDCEDDLGFGHGNVEKMNDLHMLQLLCVCSIFKLSLCGTKITIDVYLL